MTLHIHRAVSRAIGSYIFLLSLIIGMGFEAKAQERCGTVLYQNQMEKKYPEMEKKNQFEDWIKTKIIKSNLRTQEIQEIDYIIPVVFHILHDGKPIGQGKNISDKQIMSQLKVLNNDFQRRNADAFKTLHEFQPLAGSMNIKFILARQNPDGLPTDGIVRVRSTKNKWVGDLFQGGDILSYDAELKSISYWPSDKYFNIWVADLGNVLFGYAQLPQTDLPGGATENPTATIDGVVLDYRVVGSSNDGNFFLPLHDKGRTLTHETGHFFGLRHIWGDDPSCSAPDYVMDTPPQSRSSINTCPTLSQPDCTGNKMFQNYMDYTDDDCLNIFTKNQVERMKIIVENSPRRKSLTESPGILSPNTELNDLSIHRIIQPNKISCVEKVTPQIEVENHGSNNISSTLIEISLNQKIVETTIYELDLQPSAIGTLTVKPITLSPDSNEITFKILQTNGLEDSKTDNNTLSFNTVLLSKINLPITETFNTTPTKWLLYNSDADIMWENNDFRVEEDPDNRAMYLNFYENNQAGATSRLTTPPLDLMGYSSATLQFDWAYTTNGSSQDNQDVLQVVLMPECNMLRTIEVFNKSGTELTTAPPRNGIFIPSKSSHWKTAQVLLSPYIHYPNLQIAFIGENGSGNNLYLDNVSVLTEKTKSYTVYTPDFKKIQIDFLLPRKQDAEVKIFNLQGQLIKDMIFPNTRLQNYTIPMDKQPIGIYIVSITLNDKIKSTRLFINP